MTKTPEQKLKSKLINSHDPKKKIRCFYCDKPHRRKTLTLEHVLPVNYGGKTNEENCVLACDQCNSMRNRLVRYIEFIRDYNSIRDKFPNRKIHYENKYWSCINKACKILIRHSERLKINIEQCVNYIEALHIENNIAKPKVDRI